MLSARLFIGLPIDASMEEALAQADPRILEVFIRPNSPYLDEVVYEESRVLGKYLEAPCDLEALQQSETHIRSLLQKLVPGYSFETQELMLISLAQVSL